MKKGDIVRFREFKERGDETLLMALLEDPDGGRVLVKALVNMPLQPTAIYPVADLHLVSTQEELLRLHEELDAEITAENTPS